MNHKPIRLTVNPVAPADDAMRRAADVVRSGGVVAFPTDTLYGLAVDPRRDDAVRRLFELKGRSWDQPVPLIAADLDQVRRVIRQEPPGLARLASAFWPGPLTVIGPASAELARAVHAGRDTVGVRIPNHHVARRLAAALGFAITATSANRSGEPAASTAEVVEAGVGAEVDVILDAGATPGGPPSTIVDLSSAAPRLVRAGVVPWARVLESLK